MWYIFKLLHIFKVYITFRATALKGQNGATKTHSMLVGTKVNNIVT